MIKYIEIPKDGASDNVVLISEAFKKNGDYVNIDDLLFEYETSKAVFEILSEYEGYIYFNKVAGEEINVGDNICVISSKEIDSNKQKELFFTSEKESIIDQNITRKAKLLIKEHNINLSLISDSLVTEKVIKEFVKNKKITEKLKTKKHLFKPNDLVIMGVGGHAGMCIDIIKTNTEYNIKGFIDKFHVEDHKYGLEYLGELDNLDYLISCGLENLIIGVAFIGRSSVRESYYQKFSKKIKIPTIIHASSIIEPSAKIHAGCQIMAGSIIGSNAIVKENCIINSGSIISHDCTVDSSSHITPGAVLAGHVDIGKRCTIGMCATVYIECSISNDSIIKNNDSIIKSR